MGNGFSRVLIDDRLRDLTRILADIAGLFGIEFQG